MPRARSPAKRALHAMRASTSQTSEKQSKETVSIVHSIPRTVSRAAATVSIANATPVTADPTAKRARNVWPTNTKLDQDLALVFRAT